MNIYISGLECSLPNQVITNFDLEKSMDTNDEWIKSRTGISQRRALSANESIVDFAVEAAQKSLAKTNTKKEEITHIFVATCTPTMFMPSIACIVAGKLEIKQKNIYALDFNAACSGFVYGLELIRKIAKSEPHAKILFITAEALSRKINYQDRTTAVLFGDGASACIISNDKINNCSGTQFSIIDTMCYTDGSLHNLITLGGGSDKHMQIADAIDEDYFVQMQGREVYKHAVRSMAQSCIEILERNALNVDNLRSIVPHQANIRIIEAVYDKLEVPSEKRFTNVDKYGNTSASSIPLAISELLNEQDFKSKDKILLTSFGAGLTWGSSLLEIL